MKQPDNTNTTNKKQDIKAMNGQRHAYQATINDPIPKGWDHHRIKEELITGFPTLKYFCMSDEIGDKGTYHTHFYCIFSSRVRFSTMKKHFPEAHIEAAHGNVQSNIDYIRKSGKWADTEKSETCVEGTFEEWGTIPAQKGKRQDMEELYELVKAGYSDAEILAINHDHILYLDKISKTRTTLLIDKFKNTRRLDLKVTYISGATGTGKTRGILDTYGDGEVYRVTDYLHPFDNYQCQPVLVFEEFRSSLKISDMLNYCDIYPIELPARYANKYACYEYVYLTSNIPLEEQYPEIQQASPETWKAFLRRIHEVQIYDEDGTIRVYDSVEKYLCRDEDFHVNFHVIKPGEENPFTQGRENAGETPEE